MRANTVSSFKHGFGPYVSIGVQAFDRARPRRDQRRRLKVLRRPFRQERGAPRGPGGVGARRAKAGRCARYGSASHVAIIIEKDSGQADAVLAPN
jgi:hypothetical protein